ncbi:MAG: hypothetical protein KY469_05380 [Actinobacteria bacterium]|nr:hypothetical protein [Actinomycetota bacterium]
MSGDPDGAAALRTSLTLGGAVVGIAPTGPEVAAEIIRLAPDVVVLDVPTDDVRAWEVPLALERAGGSDIPVVVVAPRPWGDEVGRCLLAGAYTVLLPEDAARPAELIARAAGDVPADPVVAAHRLAALRKLADAGTERSADAISVRVTRLERPARPATRRDGDHLTLLSSAQRRVVEGMVRGRSASEIAGAAGISRQAVYGAQRRLARRLGVTTQQLADEVRQRFGMSRTRGQRRHLPV